MKFPQTTTVSKLAVKVGVGLIALSVFCLFIGLPTVAAIFGCLSGASLVAAVLIKNY